MQQRAKTQFKNGIRITDMNIHRWTLKSPVMEMCFLWTFFIALMLCHQLSIAGPIYKDDPCETKSMTGLCKEWSECSIIKTLIDRGEYSKREVVSCGFGVREELICCPVIKTETKIEVTTPKTVVTTGTAEPRDFWLDVLDEINSSNTTTSIPSAATTTTTSTTQKPDFWLDLISSTTTTTIKPLVIGNERLDESSEFFDFSQLLSRKTGNQQTDQSPSRESTNRQENPNRQTNRGDQVNTGLNQNPDNPSTQSNNKPRTINTVPVNVNANQWNSNSANHQGNLVHPNNQGQNENGLQFNGRENNFQNNNNNFFQNNWRGNRGHGPNVNHNFQNNGRGNGGLGPNIFENIPNNDRGDGTNFNNNSPEMAPGNGGHGHSDHLQNNGRGNVLNQLNNEAMNSQANNFQHSPTNGNTAEIFPSPQIDERERTEQIVNSVFQTPANSNIGQGTFTNMDDVIWDIFSEKPQPSHNDANPTVLWLNNPEISEDQDVEFVNTHTQPVAVTHEQMNMPSLVDNDLETAQSTNHHFVVVQPLNPTPNWQERSAQPAAFNPVQVVYENLVNSGMQIVKAKAEKVERIYNQHQQQQTHTGNPNIFGQPTNGQNFNEHGQGHFGQQGQGHFGQQGHRQQQGQQHPHQQQQVRQHPHQQQGHFGQQEFDSQPQHNFRPQNTVHQPNGQVGQQFREHSNRPPQQVRHPADYYQQQHNNQQQQFGQTATMPHQMQTGQQENLSQPAGEKQQLPYNSEAADPQLQQLTDAKALRTPKPFIPQLKNGPSNEQSPSADVLDPFKPFEFRPPPLDEITFVDGDNTIRPDPDTGSSERPAARACKRILKGLYKGLSPHILGGTPADLGEFPHMVAIGYSRLGDSDQGPYDIRCGGTLIDSQYVLTAAHCVAARDSVPAIARMGVVNFSDPNAMQDAIEIKIKNVFIHDAYAQRSTYNDVAVLELERAPPLGEYIHPVCLYTDRADPDPSIKLWVTGWGTVNTSTRAYSDILLKAPLHVTPIDRCNASFVDYGLTRQIKDGIISTQLCAEDKDQIRDACQGDSGGPLNLVVDESIKEYRLVGVVSSGFGCASSTPGLYTRVAAFLEFIEKIVWPNGGD